MNDLTQGFILMGLGLLGVFSTIVIFYILVVVLTKLFPEKDEESSLNSGK